MIHFATDIPNGRSRTRCCGSTSLVSGSRSFSAASVTAVVTTVYLPVLQIETSDVMVAYENLPRQRWWIGPARGSGPALQGSHAFS